MFCGRKQFLEAQGCRFEAGNVAWTRSKECIFGWWNNFLFTSTWGNDPIRLRFFNWVETTRLGHQMEQSVCHNQTLSQLQVDAYRAFATLQVRLYLL